MLSSILLSWVLRPSIVRNGRHLEYKVLRGQVEFGFAEMDEIDD